MFLVCATVLCLAQRPSSSEVRSLSECGQWPALHSLRFNRARHMTHVLIMRCVYRLHQGRVSPGDLFDGWKDAVVSAFGGDRCDCDLQCRSTVRSAHWCADNARSCGCTDAGANRSADWCTDSAGAHRSAHRCAHNAGAYRSAH